MSLDLYSKIIAERDDGAWPQAHLAYMQLNRRPIVDRLLTVLRHTTKENVMTAAVIEKTCRGLLDDRDVDSMMVATLIADDIALPGRHKIAIGEDSYNLAYCLWHFTRDMTRLPSSLEAPFPKKIPKQSELERILCEAHLIARAQVAVDILISGDSIKNSIGELRNQIAMAMTLSALPFAGRKLEVNHRLSQRASTIFNRLSKKLDLGIETHVSRDHSVLELYQTWRMTA